MISKKVFYGFLVALIAVSFLSLRWYTHERGAESTLGPNLTVLQIPCVDRSFPRYLGIRCRVVDDSTATTLIELEVDEVLCIRETNEERNGECADRVGHGSGSVRLGTGSG